MLCPSKLNHAGNTGKSVLLLNRNSLLRSTGHLPLLNNWNISVQLLLHLKLHFSSSSRHGSRDIAASPACCWNLRAPGTTGTRAAAVQLGVRRGAQVSVLVSPGQAAAALPVRGGKPSGFHSSQLGQAFQGSQAPTDFHFVFFKTDWVAVSFPTTFSRFNLRPMQTPQTFSTGISQRWSFFPAAFGENQWSYARRSGLFLDWSFLFSD